MTNKELQTCRQTVHESAYKFAKRGQPCHRWYTHVEKMYPEYVDAVGPAGMAAVISLEFSK